jgi:rubrerythrin|tara:strand:+ start:193 stop:639 length:447 start_codon:yes stop_codon:yes gene_type:complete
MEVLKDIASELMENEFDNDPCLNTEPSILSWLEANLGLLNSLINTSYCLEGSNLDSEAQAIYKQVYLHHYYSKKTRNALRGIMDASATSTEEIASISDGESRVTFANKNETAKVIRGLANDAKSTLNDLVAKYNVYQSEPRQVSGIDG